MKFTGTSFILTSLALAGALFPGAAFSQSIPSPYRFLDTRQEVDLFVGQMSPSTGRFEYGPRPGVAMGARYGLNIAGPFGIEGTLTYQPTKRDIIDPGRAEGDFKVGDMPAEIILMDARLRFTLTGNRTWHGMAPFLLAGGGLAFDGSDADEDAALLLSNDRFKFKTSFVGILGGGVRWYPGERFFFRIDSHLFLWRLRTPSGYFDPAREFESVEEREWVSGPSLTLGFGFRF